MSDVLLTLKGNAANLNKAIDSSIKKLNSLVATAQQATNASAKQAAAVQSQATGGLFSGQSTGMLASGRKVIDSALMGLDKSVQKVTQGFTSFQKKIQAVGDSLRLTSQAVSTLGRVWTFLISAPLGLFLKQQAEFAIDFEDALVRVQKVTNMSTSELRNFRDALRQVAINTSTSHIELTKIAEVIGQAGIHSTKAIVEITETINMFSIATGIAADDAATNLIRIGNAFGWAEEEMAENLKKLGSTMNKLENTNAVTAQQVMVGVAAWAQNAELLEINEAAASAFTATLVSMGMSESEAGTALRRATEGMIKNADAVSSAMSAVEGYSTTRDVANKIDEDAVGVLKDIIYAAAAGNSQAQVLMNTIEIGGARGGRALAGLATNVELLERNLAIANREWGQATSLVEEYELAMRSTKNQMALLKNNINDVGVTIGDALLPTINDLIMMIVPAIRMFNEWFQTLDNGTKRMIVLGAVGAVALGPALFMFGQLANAVSLVVLGLSRLLLIVPGIFSAVVGLIKPILIVGKLFLSWPGLILTAVVGILKVLANAGVDIAGFFTDLAAKAIAWGENLAATYASGFMSGAVRFIAKALEWVANMIASFFRGASPPKVGPLSTIDKWGSKVLEAYLKGFKKADFSILSSVGKMIERALTRGLEGKALANALAKTAQARLDLSKLIDQFNKAGKINEGLLKKITSGLGPIADNVRDLIRHWLKYNKLQEQIAAIEERRKQVKKTYTDELKAIAATNMSMKDKVEAIRAAQRGRDDNLRGLTAEQERLEEQAAIEKERMEYQQAMIDAMTEQDDLLQRMIDTLKALAEEMKGGAEVGGGGFGMPEIPETPDIDDLFEKPLEDLKTLQQRLSEGQKKLSGFIDAWNGEANKFDDMDKRLLKAKGYDTEAMEDYNTMYEIGEKAREIYDTIVKWKDAAVDFGQQLLQSFQGIAEDLDISGMFETAKNIDFKELPFVKGFQDAFKGLDPAIIQMFADAWDDLVEAFTTFRDTFFGGPIDWEEVGSKIGGALQILVNGVGIIGVAVVRLVGLWMMFMVILQQVWTRIQETYNVFVTVWSAIIAYVQMIFANFAGLMRAGWQIILTVIATVLGVIKTYIETAFAVIKALFTGNWEAIPGILSAAWTKINGYVSSGIEAVKGYIRDGLAILKTIWALSWQSLYTKLNEKWQSMKSAVESWWLLIKTAISEKLEEIKEYILGKIGEILDWIVDQYETMYSAGSNLITGLWDGIKAIWAQLKAWAEKQFGWLIDLIATASDQGSPSKVTEKQGENLAKGVADGLQNGIPDIKDAIDDVNQSLENSILSIPFGSDISDSLFALGATSIPSLDIRPAQAKRSVEININNPVVRDDSDIDEIVRRIKRILAGEVRNQTLYGGQIR